MQRRLTRRNRYRADAALERGDALLQHGIGRIREPRINVPRALHVEERGGMVAVLEHKRRRLINWRGPCAGGRIGASTGVDGKCV